MAQSGTKVPGEAKLSWQFPERSCHCPVTHSDGQNVSAAQDETRKGLRNSGRGERLDAVDILKENGEAASDTRKRDRIHYNHFIPLTHGVAI